MIINNDEDHNTKSPYLYTISSIYLSIYHQSIYLSMYVCIDTVSWLSCYRWLEVVDVKPLLSEDESYDMTVKMIQIIVMMEDMIVG